MDTSQWWTDGIYLRDAPRCRNDGFTVGNILCIVEVCDLGQFLQLPEAVLDHICWLQYLVLYTLSQFRQPVRYHSYVNDPAMNEKKGIKNHSITLFDGVDEGADHLGYYFLTTVDTIFGGEAVTKQTLCLLENC
jgi:hypothetical protein